VLTNGRLQGWPKPGTATVGVLARRKGRGAWPGNVSRPGPDFLVSEGGVLAVLGATLAGSEFLKAAYGRPGVGTLMREVARNAYRALVRLAQIRIGGFPEHVPLCGVGALLPGGLDRRVRLR
jgi:hypothetical protein